MKIWEEIDWVSDLKVSLEGLDVEGCTQKERIFGSYRELLSHLCFEGFHRNLTEV